MSEHSTNTELTLPRHSDRSPCPFSCRLFAALVFHPTAFLGTRAFRLNPAFTCLISLKRPSPPGRMEADEFLNNKMSVYVSVFENGPSFNSMVKYLSYIL